MASRTTVVLNLPTLHKQCELLPSTCRSIAAAASVTLDRLQGRRRRDATTIVGAGTNHDGIIVRLAIDDRARRTYDDPDEATEEGAEAIAILVARQVLDRIVFRRLPKRTGADYRMRTPDTLDGDKYERLECSGIGDGNESVRSRMKTKMAQMRAHSRHISGHAVITRFGRDPVEIMTGRYRR